MTDLFTTPIYYINANPHIGHAYSSIAADILTRATKNARLITGCDEHGKKVQLVAEALGIDEQAFADKQAQVFHDILEPLAISEDEWIRTTDPDHKQNVQQILAKLYAKGDIVKGVYEGYYCTACETYYASHQLLDGKLCPEHKQEIPWISEQAYLFRLEPYREKLLTHLQENPDWLWPHRRQAEVFAWLAEPLPDLAISRNNITWGIPLPWDKDHVTYVWLDALCNYLTAAKRQNACNLHRTTHILGKDILRHHALIWPILLLALEEELPKKLLVHGHLKRNGERISKTAKNGIDPRLLVKKWGADCLRSYLFGSISWGEDADFTDIGIEEHYRLLAGQWGNLVRRVLVLCERNDIDLWREGPPFDLSVYQDQIRAGEIGLAWKTALAYISETNERVQTLAPWAEKNPQDSLYELLGRVRTANELVAPFLPLTSEVVRKYLTGQTKEIPLLFPR